MTLAERLRATLDRAPLAGPFADLPEAGDPLAPAAVLIPITDRRDPGVLLTVRHADLRKHAGQIAFPGGRIDPEDIGPTAAALREAHEEIGLSRADVEIVGVTDRYLSGSGYDITPVIGVVRPDLPLVPHEAEVTEIFEVPLAFLLESGNHIRRSGEFRGRQRQYYEISWEHRRIWGVTAGVIVAFAQRLGRFT